MMASTFVSDLPDAADIHDEPSASDALFRALATVATANHKIGGAHREPGAFHKELTSLFSRLHELLPTIAEYRRDITSWSVTVGMSNTLTVNMASKRAEVEPVPDFPGQK
jgi:hypothetical protein